MLLHKWTAATSAITSVMSNWPHQNGNPSFNKSMGYAEMFCDESITIQKDDIVMQLNMLPLPSGNHGDGSRVAALG